MNSKKKQIRLIFSLLCFFMALLVSGKIKAFGPSVVEAATKKIKVDTFADISKDTSLSGKLVTTSGYSAVGDGGAATYLINSKPGDQTAADIDLGNGLYAHLQYGSTVNVAALGIFPGQECSEKVNAAVELFQGSSRKLKFNDGEYLFSKQLFLKSIKLEGAANTVFKITPDFNPGVYRLFLTDIRRHDIKYNISLSKITFLVEGSKNHNLSDKETTLLCLNDISSCQIKDCNFIARPSSNNGAYMRCQLVWFQQSNNENITISNCKFENLMGQARPGDSTDLLSGGCLWLSGNDLENRLKNVNIKNCSFTASNTDEAIGIWNYTCSGITISNCNIANSHYPNNNLMSICKAVATNVKVKNCNFNFGAPTQAGIKIYWLKGNSDISFEGCSFNSTAARGSREMDAVFYSNEASEGTDCNKNISVKNCSFSGSGEGAFDYLINIQNAKKYNYTFSGCKMMAPFQKAVVNLGNSSDCSLKASGCTINTSSTFTKMANLSNCAVAYDGNTIEGDYTTTAFMTVTGSFSFTNNICKGTGTVWVSNGADAVGFTETESNNTFQ